MSDDVLVEMGRGDDPRQYAWSAISAIEDRFKFPACRPHLGVIFDEVKKLMNAGAEDAGSIESIVRDLVQRVLWVRIQATKSRILVNFDTKDDVGGRYSYEVEIPR